MEKNLIDRISEAIYGILTGESCSPIVLPENCPDNEIKRLALLVNRLITEHQELSDLISAVARGQLYFEPPKGGIRALQDFKGLHSKLSHLTWQVQRITEGDFTQRVNFMGDFAQTFNKLISKIQEAGREIESQKKEHDETSGMLKELNKTDKLTGLANWGYFYDVISVEWRRNKRRHRPLSMIMLEIDFFKRYNEGYGYQKGNECLKRVAEKIKGLVRRPGDLSARHTGEIFAIILPDTDLKGVALLGENIRKSVEAMGLRHDYSSAVNKVVTISAGCSSCIPSDTTSYSILISSSGAALNSARRQGSNLVKLAEQGYQTKNNS